ncbi:MAG: TIGR00730 family Rossman fold protein, partial [Nitrospirota bacterium]|nr:TIGR00730 family Rossman fold protein [Nitrospirota bacterium]
MSLPENTILETPSGVHHSVKKIVLEEEIVREIKSLWTGPATDVRTALLKEMVGSVVKLRDLDTDVLDVKILHRALKELRYAFRVFRQYREVKKVSIFGSARTRVDDPNYKLASQFGKLLSQRGFMVITGGGPGIMLAGNEGAGREHSFGVNIMLPFEQAPNALIADDKKLVNLKYFFTRKLLLVKETQAVALFPGGFGTLDEAFEVLTLIQTGKTDPIPVVCIESPGGDYWQRMMGFLEQQLLSRGLINRSDLALFKLVYSAEEAVEEIQKFFRVYHSLRMVRDTMVIRIQQQLSKGELTQLNQEFSDLLADGQFQQVEALPEEWDEPHISHLPRLVLHFNWKEL